LEANSSLISLLHTNGLVPADTFSLRLDGFGVPSRPFAVSVESLGFVDLGNITPDEPHLFPVGEHKEYQYEVS